MIGGSAALDSELPAVLKTTLIGDDTISAFFASAEHPPFRAC